jgi:hypothetical protein
LPVVGRAEKQADVVFFFERQAQFIRCESRPADGGTGYELMVLYPDGREEIEHFLDTVDLNRRERELETSLTSAGWFGPHGRVI